ncbi:dynamin-1-like [Uloborus diversus]|uniref:dynamin-1-like n=1 Tax=Uloborus diversus TaxID=327109 RepID=UPI002409F845|nr:dynamin-1-like [Uloborus diversus]
MEEANLPSKSSNPEAKTGMKQLDLIDVVNDLQNKLTASGHTLDVSLPQIVVVGCQSAGKSSVLESFVGREFLPRGSNLVTRRPTVVQLQPSSGEEYAVFLHKENEKFTDFSKVKEEILNETNRKPGPVGFSSDPISLKICSPNVLKLTVVDLPGLIRNAVDGQPEESIQAVREMVLNYIQQPKCLILAVSPANQDIANSDALNIAKIADPNRERTIGVLTKLDLMDEGTDARDVLENNKIPLKRGYVGVLNRSQKEIDEGKDIEYILKKEREFFSSKECYKNIAHQMGTHYLQKLLQKMLRSHIKSCLPNVRNEISQKLNAYKRELREFENLMGNGPNGKQFYLIKLIQKFIDDINVKMMGHSETVDMKVLTVGAHIHYKLYTEVQKNLELPLMPDEGELTILIANLFGLRNAISVPSLALDAMCGKLLESYKDPLERSVKCVMDVLIAAIVESAKLIDPYPTLKHELLYRIRCYIELEAESTQSRLKEHIDAEMFYVNIAHPDFNSSVCDPVAPAAGPVKIWDTEDSEDESNNSEQLLRKLKKSNQIQQKVKYVTAMVLKYLEIVHKQIGDITIKYTVFFLVKKVMDFIKKDLIPTLVESANIASLTEDCDEDFQRKDHVESTCAFLKDALEAIQAF